MRENAGQNNSEYGHFLRKAYYDLFSLYPKYFVLLCTLPWLVETEIIMPRLVTIILNIIHGFAYSLQTSKLLPTNIYEIKVA